MSASEKLKALPLDRQRDELQDALPQIVAVVEAAEKMNVPSPPLRMLDDSFALHTALSALEEALT